MRVHIISWIIVISVLLFVPSGGLIITGLFLLLFLLKRVNSFDLILANLMIFFVQNGLASMGELSFVRFLLLGAVMVDFASKQKVDFARLFFVPVINAIFFIYLVLNVLIASNSPYQSLIQIIPFLCMLIVSFKGTQFQPDKTKVSYFLTIECLYIAILITSILVFPIKNISFARNGVGFQGISVHPNAFGIVIAPFCGLMALKFIMRNKLSDFSLFVASFIVLFLSQSRTSVFSLILGLALVFIINKDIRSRMLRKSVVAIFPIMLGILVFSTQISSYIGSFLIKTQADSFKEAVELSRGKMFYDQLENIKENPFFGIGFKIPSSKVIESDSSIFQSGQGYEKGNMLFASIEEIGIFGTLLLVGFMISQLNIRQSKNSIYIILPFVAIFTTLGEATLFSIGGVGLLIWVLIFLNRFSTYEH